uniref:G-protein coupled receptors family 3 profile domain-containing protein n=1 Tax=Xenopus tropicalis TaxID=8364 RepID=A0A1B8Y8B8_XENTR
MCVRPCRSGDQPNNPACHLDIMKEHEEYEYIQEGDIMIGGVLTVSRSKGDINMNIFDCACPSPERYRYLVEFLFLIKEINENPVRLPNVTLGYHIYDSCGNTRRALISLLKILSGTRVPVPNYSCVGKRKFAGFIGDLDAEPTVSMAHILGVLGYSQISYGATDPALSDRVAFPYFFRTVQSDEEEYIALCKVLKYFGWTWVGIIYFDNYSGYRDHQLLTKYFSREGICAEFMLKIRMNVDEYYLHIDTIEKSSSGVIIICGDFDYASESALLYLRGSVRKKTCIFLSKWLHHVNGLETTVALVRGSLSFMQNRLNDRFDPKFTEFSKTFHPLTYPHDKFLEKLWMFFLFCLSKDDKKNRYFMWDYHIPLRNCSGKEKLTDIPEYLNAYHSASLIQAVDIMVIALQDMYNSHSKQTHGKRTWMDNHNQLYLYLKNISYENKDNLVMSFNERGEMANKYFIVNPYIDTKNYSMEAVGYYVPWAPFNQRLSLTPQKIIWKTPNNKTPRAQCSDYCFPGYRKVPKPGAQSCCYDCVPCPEGEISNTTDNKNCIQCQDMERPNSRRTKCTAKTEEFLSYTNDVISIILSLISVSSFFISVLILGVFITYRDTPIVRANNRSLSFLLLVSIKLSFLSVFLFLGRPVDITCMLRIITFGITFSIAVSSLLAKTIMVCVAFKATKPGSSWRKWLGVKLSNSVVLFCSSIQIIICMTWLAISPPFQELDIHTSPGTIIIQCNEGSAIGFYSVIGYMGLLAAVSFVLAFLARSLPDSFNEAKYITFSMLLFCSVWITMIPAYLSTKGKNTVCVEIFAVLTSSAGLLACIFLPKCYTIFFRPEMNTKSHLYGNKS